MKNIFFETVSLPDFPKFDYKNYQIFDLYKIKYSFLSENSHKNDICSICLCLINNPKRSDNCQHYFCNNCLRKWSKISKKCPICRRKFKKIII